MRSNHANGESSAPEAASPGRFGLNRLACLVYRHSFVEPSEQTAALQAAMNDIDSCHAHIEQGHRPPDITWLSTHRFFPPSHWAQAFADGWAGHGDQDCCNAERFDLEYRLSVAREVCARCGEERPASNLNPAAVQ